MIASASSASGRVYRMTLVRFTKSYAEGELYRAVPRSAASWFYPGSPPGSGVSHPGKSLPRGGSPRCPNRLISVTSEIFLVRGGWRPRCFAGWTAFSHEQAVPPSLRWRPGRRGPCSAGGLSGDPDRSSRPLAASSSCSACDEVRGHAGGAGGVVGQDGTGRTRDRVMPTPDLALGLTRGCRDRRSRPRGTVTVPYATRRRGVGAANRKIRVPEGARPVRRQ
jgi:hypothetical protein